MSLEVAGDTHPRETLKIVAHYRDFEAPFDPEPQLRKALLSVPPEMLHGLDSIVLTNQKRFSRKERRETIHSGRVSYKLDGVLGRYCAGRPPYIELFVDNLAEHTNKVPWFARPLKTLLRGYSITHTLFHEIGHHVHTTQKREPRDAEKVAEEYAGALLRRYLRGRWHWPFFYVSVRVLRPVLRPLLRRAKRKSRR